MIFPTWRGVLARYLTKCQVFANLSSFFQKAKQVNPILGHVNLVVYAISVAVQVQHVEAILSMEKFLHHLAGWCTQPQGAKIHTQAMSSKFIWYNFYTEFHRPLPKMKGSPKCGGGGRRPPPPHFEGVAEGHAPFIFGRGLWNSVWKLYQINSEDMAWGWIVAPFGWVHQPARWCKNLSIDSFPREYSKEWEIDQLLQFCRCNFILLIFA